MRIVTLVENTACRENLTAEHGLSLYIETENHKILFDAGQSAAFADNAEKLGIDLSQVDMAVLSHGHYDHGGGLVRFLKINNRATVWMNPHAFEDHYNGADKYIGLDRSLLDSSRIRFAEDGQRLGEGLTLYSRMDCPYGIRPFGLTVKEQGKLVPEDFRHEQYLLIEDTGKRILISGCSHRGILNIVQWFRPDVLVGGFHFMKMDPEGAELEAASAALKRYPCVYYTGHCTGAEQFETLKVSMGQQLHRLSTGTEMIIGKEHSYEKRNCNSADAGADSGHVGPGGLQ